MSKAAKPRRPGVAARARTIFGMVLRRTLGVAGLAFVIGAAADLALSPTLLKSFPDLEAHWAPTGIAWLYLVPCLLAHGLTATLRPSMRTMGALEALTQPPPSTGRLAWSGFLALALLALPAAAIWVHWAFALIWAVLLLATLRLSLLPATLMANMPTPLRAALEVGYRPLPAVLGLSVVVLGVCFIVSNIVLSVVMLPLSKAASPDFQPGSGLLPLLQVNLLLAFATPGLAAVIAAAWQTYRQRAWVTTED